MKRLEVILDDDVYSAYKKASDEECRTLNLQTKLLIQKFLIEREENKKEKNKTAEYTATFYKTPKEIGRCELQNYFSCRLSNILYWQDLKDVRICDIKKNDLLKCRNAGTKTWEQFYKVVKN
jgi:hypothetical protein